MWDRKTGMRLPRGWRSSIRDGRYLACLAVDEWRRARKDTTDASRPMFMNLTTRQWDNRVSNAGVDRRDASG